MLQPRIELEAVVLSVAILFHGCGDHRWRWQLQAIGAAVRWHVARWLRTGRGVAAGEGGNGR
jgi:hypothetical protein